MSAGAGPPRVPARAPAAPAGGGARPLPAPPLRTYRRPGPSLGARAPPRAAGRGAAVAARRASARLPAARAVVQAARRPRAPLGRRRGRVQPLARGGTRAGPLPGSHDPGPTFLCAVGLRRGGGYRVPRAREGAHERQRARPVVPGPVGGRRAAGQGAHCPGARAFTVSSEDTHQSSGSQSRKPLAKGLLAILSCVICREAGTEQTARAPALEGQRTSAEGRAMLRGALPGRAPLLSADRNRPTTARSPEGVPFSCSGVSVEPPFSLRNPLRGPKQLG